MMRPLSSLRRNLPDLLARPPCASAVNEQRWARLAVDPTDQLALLADLLGRGLLSIEEYEQHKAKVLDR